MGEDIPGYQRTRFQMIDGKLKFCTYVVLDGGGLVRTRWCDSGEEARAEANHGYVHYVEDYPEVE